MVSRRLLRIKTLLVLYAYNISRDQSINNAEKELFHSINKTYDLYHYLLLLLVDIADYAKDRIELAKQKRMPTHEDLNPNTKFIDNEIIRLLRDNINLASYLVKKKMSWINYPELIKELYLKIKESADYSVYMSEQERNLSKDKEFVSWIYAEIIAQHDSLFQAIEEQSIYWGDDVEFVIGMIMKTLERFSPKNGQDNKLMRLFKNDDDLNFVKLLFRKSILNQEKYTILIEQYAKNWDLDRIAFIDNIIMQMAIAEILEFPSIPIKVTLNEYIELAKFYSTAKSCPFINGILDKVVEHLKKEKKILKTGRGLQE